MPTLATVISSTTLTGDQQYVTLSSIPQDYKHLRLVITARSTDTPDWFTVALNGDFTGSNYFSRLMYADRNAAINTGSQTPSAEPPLTGVINKFNSLTNSFSDADVTFYNYTVNGNSVKVFSGTSGQNNSADPARQAFWENRWNNSVPITAIRLGNQAAVSSYFATGTTITLYGLP